MHTVLAFDSKRLVIPTVTFTGLSSAYGLSRNTGIKLDDTDIGRAKDLLEYGFDGQANEAVRYLAKTYLSRKFEGGGVAGLARRVIGTDKRGRHRSQGGIHVGWTS